MFGPELVDVFTEELGFGSEVDASIGKLDSGLNADALIEVLGSGLEVNASIRMLDSAIDAIIEGDSSTVVDDIAIMEDVVKSKGMVLSPISTPNSC